MREVVNEIARKIALLRDLDILIGRSALSYIHKLLILSNYFGRITACH
jgi:hypothetical protein